MSNIVSINTSEYRIKRLKEKDSWTAEEILEKFEDSECGEEHFKELYFCLLENMEENYTRNRDDFD